MIARLVACLAVFASLAAWAEDVVKPVPEKPSSGWTGSGALLLGEGDPHSTSIDAYMEGGRRLNADLAVLGVVLGEASISSVFQRDALSAGVALRLTGDVLGGLPAPLELTFGGGVSTLVRGTAPIGGPPYYAMAFVDAVFPVTQFLRVHWNIFEHVNDQGSFLTAGFGIGITFE